MPSESISSRANSRDLPEWCLGSMKYYRPEYFDISQVKKGPVDTTKRDIFGKKSYPDNPALRDQFVSEVPFIGSRNVKLNVDNLQRKQMVFRDRVYEKNIRSKTTDSNKLEHLRMTNVDLHWPEDGKGNIVKQRDVLTKSIGVACILFTVERAILFEVKGQC